MEYRWGVACFTQSEANSAMWAHYARSHSGVCLAYDAEAVVQKIEAFNQNQEKRVHQGSDIPHRSATLQRVNYVDTLPALFEDSKAAIYSKTSDWSYEKEWRLAVKGILQTSGEKMQPWADNSVEGFCFDVSGCLAGVFYGHRAHRSQVRALEATVGALDSSVEIRMATPNFGSSGYSIE